MLFSLLPKGGRYDTRGFTAGVAAGVGGRFCGLDGRGGGRCWVGSDPDPGSLVLADGVVLAKSGESLLGTAPHGLAFAVQEQIPLPGPF